MYWPPAEPQTGIFAGLSGVSPAVQASVAGGLAVILVAVAVCGSVHHYKELASQVAPQQSVRQASFVPIPTPATVRSAPAMPAPIIMRRAPDYTPPAPRLAVPPTANWGQSQDADASQSAGGGAASAPTSSPQVDEGEQAKEQAKAATDDAVKAGLTGQLLLPNMSATESNWTMLESEVQADNDTVSGLQDRLDPDLYSEAMREITRASDSLSQNKQTWLEAKEQEGIHI